MCLGLPTVERIPLSATHYVKTQGGRGFVYIAVTSHAVSLVLVQADSGVQRPVYHVSKSLHEAKVRYLPLEKAILAMVHATRKLPRYFQSHTMVVLA